MATPESELGMAKPTGSPVSSQASDGASLESRILGRLDGLTPKQRKLARFLLDNQLYVSFASAQRVGQLAGVDAATVVRFSRLLGYEGFADLRNALRGSMPAFLTATEKLSRTLATSSDDRDIVDLVYSQDIDNIRATSRSNPAAAFAGAIDRLSLARDVYVVGTGMSAPVAQTLAHEFGLIGVRAFPVVANFVQSAVQMAQASSEDVVVAISLWRYLRDTVELVTAAREMGATVIALTDNKMAPVVPHADIVLVASTQTPEIPHSVTSLMTLSTALVSALALVDPDRTLATLHRLERLYERSQVMLE